MHLASRPVERALQTRSFTSVTPKATLQNSAAWSA
jgi:hypothetical protein